MDKFLGVYRLAKQFLSFFLCRHRTYVRLIFCFVYCYQTILRAFLHLFHPCVPLLTSDSLLPPQRLNPDCLLEYTLMYNVISDALAGFIIAVSLEAVQTVPSNFRSPTFPPIGLYGVESMEGGVPFPRNIIR